MDRSLLELVRSTVTVDGRRFSSVYQLQWHVCLRDRSPRISEYAEQKTAEKNSIVHSGKSEVEVTNNGRLRSTYCTIEANYYQTRSIAQLLCDSRATCLYV